MDEIIWDLWSFGTTSNGTAVLNAQELLNGAFYIVVNLNVAYRGPNQPKTKKSCDTTAVSKLPKVLLGDLHHGSNH